MLDLIIKNGKVFDPEKGFLDLEVGIQDGKIKALGSNLSDAKEVLDAGGKIVMPGVIDPHIHLGIFNDFAHRRIQSARSIHLNDDEFGITLCRSFQRTIDVIIRCRAYSIFDAQLYDWTRNAVSRKAAE